MREDIGRNSSERVSLENDLALRTDTAAKNRPVQARYPVHNPGYHLEVNRGMSIIGRRYFKNKSLMAP